MRRVLTAAVGAALCGTALAAQDVLATLEVRPNQAGIVVLEVLDSGRPYHEVGKAVFLAATPEARVSLVNGALAWAKAYTESPEFATQYAATRRPRQQAPAVDARPAIATRLREFLTLSATVDFGAKLVPCRNSQRSCFADPAYEGKPGDWKKLYRAGKEPVDAARAFATKWLADIEKK